MTSSIYLDTAGREVSAAEALVDGILRPGYVKRIHRPLMSRDGGAIADGEYVDFSILLMDAAKAGDEARNADEAIKLAFQRMHEMAGGKGTLAEYLGSLDVHKQSEVALEAVKVWIAGQQGKGLARSIGDADVLDAIRDFRPRIRGNSNAPRCAVSPSPRSSNQEASMITDAEEAHFQSLLAGLKARNAVRGLAARGKFALVTDQDIERLRSVAALAHRGSAERHSASLSDAQITASHEFGRELRNAAKAARYQ